MSRFGYLTLCVLLLALGVYVFWQEPVEVPLEHLWSGDAPTRYRLLNNGIEQQIDGKVVLVNGLKRPLDQAAHERLWQAFSNVGWLPNQSIAGVAEDQLSAYGIDGSRELSGDRVRLRWGRVKSDYYIWDGMRGRIYTSYASLHNRMEQVAIRLDQAQVLNLEQVTRIRVDGLTLALDKSQSDKTRDVQAGPLWLDTLQPQRPDFNRRVNQLYDLLLAIRLSDLSQNQPRLVKPLHTMTFTSDDVTQPDQQVRIWNDAATWVVQVDDYPVQRIDETKVTAWNKVITSFEHDYLFNLFAEFSRQPLAEVQVMEGKNLRFRLEKHGLQDVSEGRSQWDVIWPGGREPASAYAAPMIASTFDELIVNEPRRRGAEDNPSSDALTITFVFQQDRRTISVAIDKGRVYSARHLAQISTMPELLSDLSADRMLDPALTFRGAERVVKIQRQWRQGAQAGRAETFAVQAGSGTVEGQWQQTWPESDKGHAISVVAIDQVARALCTAVGQDVRLSDSVDRASVAAAEFEIDIRFAPVAVRLSNDHSRLVDTNDQDLGFAFVRRNGHWRAIEKDGGVSYGVSDELVELLQAPLLDDLVLPLIPSLVTRIDIYSSAGRMRLVQNDQAWRMQELDAAGGNQGEVSVAYDIAVRRYLRLLAGMRSQRNDATAGPFSPQELVGTVVCVFPGAEQGETRLTLSIGPNVAGVTAVVVEGGAGMRGLPRGRAYVASDQIAQLLPGINSFRPPVGSQP